MASNTSIISYADRNEARPAALELRSDPDLSHHSGSRGFVVVFLLSMLAGYLVLLAINILGNASNLFPSPLRPALTERAWKTRRIAALAHEGKPPDVIILGSSRVMQIRPSYIAALTGGRVFNYGVSAAGPVDWHAQLGFLLSQGAKPKLIILGIDEFCFGDVYSRWQMQNFGDLRLAMHMPLLDFIPLLGDVLQNADPLNTYYSWKAIRGKNEDHPLRFSNRSEYVLADGYMVYKPSKPISIKAAAAQFLKKNIGVPDDATAMTPRRLKLFNGFLDTCRENKIEVRVMLLPLQPQYAQIIMSGDPHLDQTWHAVAAYLATDCPQHGAIFKDFSDPKSFGGDPNEFWDGAHVTAENARRMMNALFDKPPMQMATTFPSDKQILEEAMPPSAISKKKAGSREKAATTERSHRHH